MEENILKVVIDTAVKYEKKSLVEMALKLSEEQGELAEAVLSYTNAGGCGYKGKTIEDIWEEIADVIIVATAMCPSVGMNVEQLQEIIQRKTIKWIEKSK